MMYLVGELAILAISALRSPVGHPLLSKSVLTSSRLAMGLELERISGGVVAPSLNTGITGRSIDGDCMIDERIIVLSLQVLVFA
jgi:hypothetical protein